MNLQDFQDLEIVQRAVALSGDGSVADAYRYALAARSPVERRVWLIKASDIAKETAAALRRIAALPDVEVNTNLVLEQAEAIDKMSKIFSEEAGE